MLDVMHPPQVEAPRNGHAVAPEGYLGEHEVSLGEARVALVHDWLPVYAGAERVLEQMIAVLPQAVLYSLIDFVPEDQRAFLQDKEVHTSFMQRLPFSRSWYRYYLPFTPLAIEQFDLTDYDVIVSSSYVVAKGALTTADQLHVSYVHSPIRYAWDLRTQYLRRRGFDRGLRGLLARSIMHYMRLFDAATADRADLLVANSQHVARRIWKTYRRPAEVVYPPVDTEAFALCTHKDHFYVTVSRLVAYKRIDLIVEAFSAMPEHELLVIGEGPEYHRLARKAGPNVTLLGYQPQEAVQYYLQHARGFIFAAEEDFGIVPVEAQACGTPVLAYGRGGALETVIPGVTGLFFEKQTVESLQAVVRCFEQQRDVFEPERIRRHAEQFSIDRFRQAFREMLEQACHSFAMHGTVS